jgi:formate dehydrogenase maturation protein FdhE
MVSVAENDRASAFPAPAKARRLSRSQLTAICTAMAVFRTDDLARGVPEPARTYCDACQGPRPLAGALRYDRYLLCNTCATAYEVARARGLLATAGQFVREHRFGEGDRYRLDN